MTIWRPSIAAGTTAQQWTSGRVATIIPPECWERWRGRPWASCDNSTSQRQRPGGFRPSLQSTRHAFDLPRRQSERLAELADRAARAVRREGGDERRMLAAEALVH